jgi:hypothetical protein
MPSTLEKAGDRSFISLACYASISPFIRPSIRFIIFPAALKPSPAGNSGTQT